MTDRPTAGLVMLCVTALLGGRCPAAGPPAAAFSAAPVFVSGVVLLPDGSPAPAVMLSARDAAKGPAAIVGSPARMEYPPNSSG